MLAHMLRFEWRYHTHRLVFLGVAIAVCGMAFVMVRTGYAADAAHINAPATVMQSSGLLSLWLLFSQTLFTANGVLRDDEYRMRELIFSRPVSRWQYLASRYLGVVLAGSAVFVAAMLVLMVMPFLLPIEAERIGPLFVGSYLRAFGTLILPNLLLVSAVLCAVAWFTRSTVATYVGGIAVVALYMMTALLVDSPLMAGTAPPTPEALARAALLDPFGLSAFFEQVRYWTTAERNVRPLELRGHYLQNRLLVLAVTSMLLMLCHRYVPLGARTRAVRRSAPRGERGSDAARTELAVVRETLHRVIAPTTNARARFWHALRTNLRLELRLLFGGRVFKALAFMFVLTSVMEASTTLRAGDYGTRILANSGALAASVPLRLFALLCLIYLGAELVWRERAVGVDALVDATPASNGAFALSKLLALSLVPMALAAVGLGVAVVVHLLNDGLPVEPSIYLLQFWFAAYPLSLLAVLIVTLQVVAGNRWVGMLAAILLVIVSLGGPLIGLEHPMLRMMAAPDVRYSALDGYGAAAPSFAAFMAYWSAFAVLLATISWSLWRRGLDARLSTRVARAWRGGATPHSPRISAFATATLLALALFAVVGAVLFGHTNILHAWEDSAENTAWRADYERQYRHLDGAPLPSVTRVEIAVDFTPPKREATVRGTLSLRNFTAHDIDTVWVAVRRDAQDATLSLSDATEVVNDTRFGMHAWALHRTLKPGDSATLQYAMRLDRAGIRADGFAQDVAANGSYLTMVSAMPSFGYRVGYQLTDPVERKTHALGAASTGMHEHDATDSLALLARAGARRYGWFTMHATLSTTDGQAALGPGIRDSVWSVGDRSYASFRVPDPMPGRFAFSSGRYDVQTVLQDGVAIEMWYHPAHARNVQRILHAATRSLALFGSRFGAYPHSTLRLIEVPAGWPFAGFAMGGMLFFSEDRGMLTDAQDDDVDLLTRRVAHEVAHQWWGYVLDPIEVVGAGTIVETLAKYSEQLAVEAEHGPEALVPMMAFDHDRYLAGRAIDRLPEPTLLTVDEQSYMNYGKGAIAMHALRAVLGDAAIARALRGFIASDGGPRGAPVARTLYENLYSEATTDEARSELDEWFTQRVLYDLRAESATRAPDGGGYLVDARFRADRVIVSVSGEQSQPADGQRFDVVVRGEADRVLHRASVIAHQGTVSFSVRVAELPYSVAIDPEIRRLDRERSNNARPIDDADVDVTAPPPTRSPRSP